jgi:anti-sigma-K factor RskA
MRDEHVDDLIDLYALGALEPNEQAAVDEHLDECARCRAQFAEAKQLVALLAWTPDQHDPPPDLRDRLMRRVQQLKRVDTNPNRRWWQRLFPEGRGLLPRLGPALAGAAIALALLLGGRTLQLQQNVNTLTAQLRDQQVLLDVLREPGTRLVTLRPSESDPQATVQLLVNVDRGRAYAVATALPALPTEQTYQLWLIAEGENPTSAGVFDVTQQGTAVVPLDVERSLDQFAAVAISIEPEGGSDAPTTTPLLVTEL